ncbi:S8 family serine peptidase [Patescibacteria group bacterium]|nr:S8 family serine peptidase [Patescibacteria group bacterium]
MDNNHNKASFSNYGPRVDLAAPGVDIITTSLGNLYQLIDGTSESAPLFAGALAWIMSKG